MVNQININPLIKGKILADFFKNKPIKKAFLFGSYALEKILNLKVDLVGTEGVSSHILPFINQNKR
jgi:predicted nucleotidyltransferase